jgi:hypothetical protein
VWRRRAARRVVGVVAQHDCDVYGNCELLRPGQRDPTDPRPAPPRVGPRVEGRGGSCSIVSMIGDNFLIALEAPSILRTEWRDDRRTISPSTRPGVLSVERICLSSSAGIRGRPTCLPSPLALRRRSMIQERVRAGLNSASTPIISVSTEAKAPSGVFACRLSRRGSDVGPLSFTAAKGDVLARGFVSHDR